MFAINHAATALIIKKAFPGVSIVAALLSVQLIEIIWAVLNFVGVERTTTGEKVQSVSDVHLEYMPFSHSVATTAGLSLVAWLIIGVGFRAAEMATAVSLGIASHLALDLVSHARDIAIAPFVRSRKLGLGLYDKPVAAFSFELLYGVFCWWVYQGSVKLLTVIILFNLANASFFLRALPGPERLLARRPKLVTAVVAFQIVVTAVLIGLLS
jgi:hypothetical protein